MPEGATLRLEGYTLAMKLLAASDKASRKSWRDEIRQATDHVRVDAAPVQPRVAELAAQQHPAQPEREQVVAGPRRRGDRQQPHRRTPRLAGHQN